MDRRRSRRLLAGVVSVVAGLALVGTVARGLGTWPADGAAAASSRQAADGSTTSRVTLPDGGTATVHRPAPALVLTGAP